MVIRGREAEKQKHQRQLAKYKDSGLDYDFESRDQFNKHTSVLNKGNFTVPGQGQKPDYCGASFLGYIHESGNSAAEIHHTCKLSRCPSCSKKWVDQQVFYKSLVLELYSRFCGSRPFRAVSSIPDDKILTLDSLRKTRRTAKNRIKKQGVFAGFSLNHPFRIINEVKTAIRVLRPGVGSGGMWSYILEPSNIPEINQYLQKEKYFTWRDCVKLSPHVHYLLFPGDQKITGNAEIVITKLITECEDGTKIITLDHVEDIVLHLRYLFTHSEILINAGDYRSDPAGFFGDLFNWDFTEHFTANEIMQVQAEILEVLNRGRDKPYTLDESGELTFLSENENSPTMRERGYIPVHEYLAYDPVSREAQDAWLASIKNLDNRSYCEYLIDLFERLKDSRLPGKMKRLFTSRTLFFDSQGNDVVLSSPPDSFAFVKIED
ncbi:hypothetical protein [uncultured Methanolobus sp.]|uniref:hypothetical protein n=1 Tax=uncultured Methanolobus sp. TaxID=218300 RepID=UPI002AAAD87E|nr:hypothetical protein [uncultured Methanolobus sp.]